MEPCRTPYPAEFRADVVRVARKRETSLVQIAKDFGISDATLGQLAEESRHRRWGEARCHLRRGGRDPRAQEAQLGSSSRKTRSCAGRPPISPRSCPQKNSTRWSLTLPADGIPVTVTCRVLGFSTQAFNKWRRNPVSQRDWDEAHLINAAIDIHDDDPAFGYRFISDELADARLRGQRAPGVATVFASRASGASLPRRRAFPRRLDHRSTMIWWAATSPQTAPMPSG